MNNPVSPVTQYGDPSSEPKCGQDYTYASDWMTVEQAIYRGKKLRVEKLFNAPGKRKPKLVSEADRCPKKLEAVYSNSFSPPVSSTITWPSAAYSPFRQKSPPRSSTQPNITFVKDRKPIRCPLRVAELAEPKKRQCLENWRHESGTLPGFMLDRLKQHVLSQKPVVKIPEAIQCFKRKLSASKKIDKTMSSRRAQAIAREEKQDRLFLTNWSALFAHRIAQKLMKTQKIILTNKFEQLSNVIASEINNMFTQQKKYQTDYMNDEILKEMSNKVTIWIASILDDVNYKMLEDELRAKRLKENQMGRDGQLGTLIEKYILLHFEGQQDLEEEEGPALDLLETLIDKIVNICMPVVESPDNRSQNIYDSPQENSETEDSGTSRRWTLSPDSPSPESPSPASHTDSPHQFSEQSDDEHDKQLQVDNQLINKETTIDPADATSSSTDPVDAPLNITNDELDATRNDLRNILNTLIDQADLNVSDVFVVMSEDNSDEKRKVKFSNVDAESRGVGSIETKETNDISKQTSWTPNIPNKPDLVFAPPKESLLSIIDELWPNDIVSTSVKSTASVSKSVSSLGNIVESEEKLDIPSPQEKSDDSKEKSNKLEETVSVIDLEAKVQIQEDDTSLKPQQAEEDQKSVETKKESLTTREESISSKTFSGFTQNELEKKQRIVRNGKGDHDTETQNNLVSETKEHKPDSFKPDSLNNFNPKFNYKVNLDTAPSWVIHSPSEDSIFQNSTITIGNPEKRVAIWEIRQWCKDLENTLINLEQWLTWIDNKCHRMLILKEQSYAEGPYGDKRRHLKEWSKLKKNIDKDALLWSKLNRRTLDVLETYYTSNELDVLSEECKSQEGDCSTNSSYEFKSVFEAMYFIDQFSVWLHRLIVSTEYCVKCHCYQIYSQRKRGCKSAKFKRVQS